MGRSAFIFLFPVLLSTKGIIEGLTLLSLSFSYVIVYPGHHAVSVAGTFLMVFRAASPPVCGRAGLYPVSCKRSQIACDVVTTDHAVPNILVRMCFVLLRMYLQGEFLVMASLVA